MNPKLLRILGALAAAAIVAIAYAVVPDTDADVRVALCSLASALVGGVGFRRPGDAPGSGSLGSSGGGAILSVVALGIVSALPSGCAVLRAAWPKAVSCGAMETTKDHHEALADVFLRAARGELPKSQIGPEVKRIGKGWGAGGLDVAMCVIRGLVDTWRAPANVAAEQDPDTRAARELAEEFLDDAETRFQ